MTDPIPQVLQSAKVREVLNRARLHKVAGEATEEYIFERPELLALVSAILAALPTGEKVLDFEDALVAAAKAQGWTNPSETLLNALHDRFRGSDNYDTELERQAQQATSLLRARVAELEQELRNIATAVPGKWEGIESAADANHEFRLWAQNRARHALLNYPEATND